MGFKKYAIALVATGIALPLSANFSASEATEASLDQANPAILLVADKDFKKDHRNWEKDKRRGMKERRDEWKEKNKERRDELKEKDKERREEMKERREQWKENHKRDGKDHFDPRKGEHRPDFKRPDGHRPDGPPLHRPGNN